MGRGVMCVSVVAAGVHSHALTCVTRPFHIQT